MARLYTKRQLYTKLTRRQRDFLEALIELYKETRESVSYKEVAEKMGVSKWTAYDLIQELNRKGFLKVEYRLRPGPGRSEVRFIPKDASMERVGAKEKKNTVGMISEWIKERLKKYEKMEIAKAISLVSRKVEKEKHPLSVVLYTTMLFILFAKIFKIDIEKFVDLNNLMSSKIQASVLLSFLAELMFSLTEKEENVLKELNLRDYTLQKFKILQKKFRENLPLITPDEQKKVLNVIKEMV
jgi:DNA-binding Lrp family transcriptional regulator